ncbi:phosphatase PAP2 family protein [Pyrodictium abyssi]|uniref:Inositolphosphotransferase Aur1/Ipt1 domain-containing protein n=1 Tax=Pyrodictium abyssi TaxID=54256 RepID=A0ABN6ZTA9_9CREN|nr:hypothetical protein PABY_15370 [Pyrodictium abyssi]
MSADLRLERVSTCRPAGAAALAVTGIVPFLAAYAGYELARSAALALRGVIVYEPLVGIERRLFGEPLAVILSVHRNELLDIVTGIVYAVHPLYFLAFSLYLLYRCVGLFRSLLASFVIASTVATLVYALYPTAPPWIAIPGVSRPPNLLLELAEAILGSRVDPNPFAAMPSMHVCMATIFAYYYWRMSGRVVPGAAWVVLMAFSTLYTANHYLVDVVAGSILGLASCHVGWRLARPSSRQDL